MQNDYDDYEEYDGPGLRWMSVVILLLAIGGFFALAWYAYYTGTQSVESDDVVIIEAEDNPLKRAPDNPGGMEFPHADKTIYDVVDGSATEEESPVVVDTTEDPVMPESAPDEVADKPEQADDKIAQIIEQAVKETQDEAEKEKASDASASDIEVSEPQTQPHIDETATETAKAEPINESVDVGSAEVVTTPKPAPSPIATTPSPATQSSDAMNYTLQLGAYRSEQEAESTWQKIRAKHVSVIGNNPHKIIRADLGAKGVFYRLRVGGFASGADASSTCSQLTGQGQACFPAGKL